MKSHNLSMGLVKKVAFILALIVGCVLTVIGLSGFSWPRPIPWDDAGALLRFLGFLLFSALAVGFLTRKLHVKIYLAASVVAIVLALSAGAIWPLLVALWFALSSTLLGRWLFQKLKMEDKSLITYFLIGAGFYGTVMGLFAHLPVNYPGTYGIALALPLVFERQLLQQWLRKFCVWLVEAPLNPRDISWLDLPISVVALVLFVVALMPEVGHDALAVHLFIPAHLLQRHQWGFDATTYLWAVIPLMSDWIFSISYMLGGETAARLTNVGFIFVLGLLVRALVVWAGGSAAGARWAVLLFLSSPLTFAEGNSLFVDAVWATFLVAGTLAILRVCSADSCKVKSLTSAGALLGYALAAKAVTFTFLPVLLLPILWKYKTWLRAGVVKTLLPGLILFLLFGGIPYITAWWLTGNPIFPYFNQIFQSPLWSSSNFSDSRWSKGLSWDFIYRVTFQSGKYLEATPGAAGFQWLLVFLPSLAILVTSGHRRGMGLLAVAILSILLCFHMMAYLRYIFPAFAVLVAVIGVGISAIPAMAVLQVRLVYAAATTAVILNLLFYSAGPFVYRDFPIKAIFSDTHRDAYLLQRLPIRNAVKLVNAINLQRTPVAVFGTPQVAGLSANALMANWYNHNFQNQFFAVKTKQDVTDLLIQNRVDFMISDSPADELKAQYELLNQVSTEVAQFGSIRVLRFNDDFRFNKELLLNPDFSAAPGWLIGGDSSFDATSGTVLTSVSTPVTQSINVIPGQRYKNTVVARCHSSKTEGRVQVNWYDSKGAFIRTDIQLFKCSADWSEIMMKVIAPDNVSTATVYATGHTEMPLIFKSVSFKQ
jgi:hypothetical protein